VIICPDIMDAHQRNHRDIMEILEIPIINNIMGMSWGYNGNNYIII
jgi:hypothetical protein